MKKIVLGVVAIIVIIAVFFAFFYNGDEIAQIQKFIDEHNTGTVYYPPSGFGGLSYKNVDISNGEIIGIGYHSEDVCLYSQEVERTYVEYFGWIYYIVYCQITFTWGTFGDENFRAYVGFAPQDTPDSIWASLVVDNFVYKRMPHFEDVSIIRGRTEFSDQEMKTIARVQANDLIYSVDSYLAAQGLPELY